MKLLLERGAVVDNLRKAAALGLGILIAITAVSTTIWSARYAPWVEQRPVAENPIVARLREMKAGAERRAGRTPQSTGDAALRTDAAVEPRPPLAEGPPFPKTVVTERVFDFSRMGTAERRTHVFRIQNKGEAPLVIAKGPTECKCTRASDKFVKVSLEPNGGDKRPARALDRQQVRFIFEVPPGSPAVNYLTGEPVHVTVTPNHPRLPDLDFDLSFVSR